MALIVTAVGNRGLGGFVKRGDSVVEDYSNGFRCGGQSRREALD